MVRLKVGIQLPEVEREVRWPELRDMARASEQAGFDSLWVGDHLLFRDPELPPRGPWEAWSVLAALAAVTERVHLGPLVASVSFHNPAMLARKAATIDEIGGGRHRVDPWRSVCQDQGLASRSTVTRDYLHATREYLKVASLIGATLLTTG